MALTRTFLGRFASSNGHGTGTFTTSSFTPPNSSLLVVVAHANSQTGASFDFAANGTIADSQTLTWTSRLTQNDASSGWAWGSRIWTAPVTTGASMTLDIANGGSNTHVYVVDVWAFEGYDSGSPTGATASSGALGTDGAQSLTLSANPASDSYVLAAVHETMNSGASSITVGTGWTEESESNESGWWTVQSQYRTGSTSTTVTWDDLNGAGGSVLETVGLALEIKAAAGGGGIVGRSIFSSPIFTSKVLQ